MDNYAGLDERDRQLGQIGRAMHITCRSSVFLGWFAGYDIGAIGDRRPVHIEIGTL